MTNQRIRVFLCIGDRFDIARAARGLPKVRDGHADAREQARALRCQLVAKRHEEADSEVGAGAVHQLSPRNIKTVMTKSRIRTLSDEITTVRVVALDTPSAVGVA